MVTDAQSPAPAPSAGLHELLGLAAPDGTAWALWIDHWATPAVDPGGFSILDPATCTERTAGLVSLPTDPIDVAFLAR